MFDFGYQEIPDSAILGEYLKRKGKLAPVEIRDPLFHRQNAVLDDRKHRFKCVNTTRRGAKSTTEAIDHIEICNEFPESFTVYFGLTIGSVRNIIWDVFKSLNNKHSLGMKFNETESSIRYPNGSRTILFGLDASEEEMKKVLGTKIRKATIDETGSMRVNIETFIKQKLRPALADLRPNSWCSVVGTCENIPKTYFEKVSTGKDPDMGWSIHRWTTFENPHMAKQWGEELAEMRAANPDIDKASWFRTHYLNEWCSDDELLIIPASKMQFVDILPHSRDWYYVLGVDLGFNDDSSYSVIAASHTVRCAYVIHTYKSDRQDFQDVADSINKIKSEYPISRLVIDGANKQGIETMKNRMNLHDANIAEKQGKVEYLRLLKDDVIIGMLKFVNGKCDALKEEWESLQWLSVKGERRDEEDPRCPNHLSDATLYAWRETYAYMAENLPDVPPVGSPEHYNKIAENMEKEDEESRDQEGYFEGIIAGEAVADW